MSVRHASEEDFDGVAGTVIPDVPDTPTSVSATDGGTSRAFNNGAATVAFTPAVTGGAPSTYTATSSPGSFTQSGSSSPLTVTGLTGGTAYTYTVTAANAAQQKTTIHLRTSFFDSYKNKFRAPKEYK